MLEALVAGQRDPKVLAELARGRLRVKHAALVEALTGQFNDHHAFVARSLLDQIDTLGGQIDQLTTRIEEAITAIPGRPSTSPDPGPPTSGQPPIPATPATTGGPTADAANPKTPASWPPWTAWTRSPGSAGPPPTCSAPNSAPNSDWTWGSSPPRTPGVMARLSPRTIQSGAKHRTGTTGKANPYLKGTLGEVAAAAAKTDTFLGQRYRRLVRRTGKRKALVAVARSILVIIWHLLADPTARFHDLGPDYYTNHIDKDHKTRNHIRQLQALGDSVTLTPAA